MGQAGTSGFTPAGRQSYAASDSLAVAFFHVTADGTAPRNALGGFFSRGSNGVGYRRGGRNSIDPVLSPVEGGGLGRRDNVTTAAIDATGRFAATVLSEAAPMELIGAGISSLAASPDGCPRRAAPPPTCQHSVE